MLAVGLALGAADDGGHGHDAHGGGGHADGHVDGEKSDGALYAGRAPRAPLLLRLMIGALVFGATGLLAGALFARWLPGAPLLAEALAAGAALGVGLLASRQVGLTTQPRLSHGDGRRAWKAPGL